MEQAALLCVVVVALDGYMVESREEEDEIAPSAFLSSHSSLWCGDVHWAIIAAAVVNLTQFITTPLCTTTIGVVYRGHRHCLLPSHQTRHPSSSWSSSSSLSTMLAYILELLLLTVASPTLFAAVDNVSQFALLPHRGVHSGVFCVWAAG
jgi:hypothetical protein